MATLTNPYADRHGLLNDEAIAHYARHYGMITPFVGEQVTPPDGGAGYGLDSFGYTLRLAPLSDAENIIYGYAHWTDNYIIPTGKSMILMSSLERIKMPPNVSGLLYLKSTHIRNGLFLASSPLEAGWEGNVTLAVHNPTNTAIKLMVGHGIAQVQVYQGHTPTVTYAQRKGRYQGSTGAVGAITTQE